MQIFPSANGLVSFHMLDANKNFNTGKGYYIILLAFS